MWVCDPVLNFRLRSDLVTPEGPLNRDGFRTREFADKLPGVFRVLALGDSCTFGVLASPGVPFGHVAVPYPRQLENLLTTRFGRERVEVLNAGIAGYNSFQGVLLLRTKLRGLEPDLITVRYGWNDSFMSWADPAGYREPESPLALRLQDLLLRTASYGFVRRLRLELLALRADPTLPVGVPTEWKPNVPVDLYAHNLRRMVELGRAQGAEVWLLTSPHALLIDEVRARVEEIPKLLLALNAIPSFERLAEIHDLYNQAVRDVGAKLNAPVVDMDAAYRQRSDEPLFFVSDFPHPTQAGHELEAQVLYARILAAGLLDGRAAAEAR
jgi:lysophospholipase L1-like esterase